MTCIVLGHLSSAMLSLVSVQVKLCPHSYYLSHVFLICLYLFFLRILHVVHCVVFGQMAFSLYVQTIKVFAQGLFLAELFVYLMITLFVHSNCISCNLPGDWGRDPQILVGGSWEVTEGVVNRF